MMRLMRFLMVLVCFLVLVPVPSVAQMPAVGKVMIVLDASGSMWGEIGGEPKIVIARRVIHDLLRDWDPRIEIGLAAYGHRRKGDCKDIEVLVTVGRDKQKSILAAVDRLKPKGMTPLSDAVRMAAESLKYTEERATVILVSDGRETCEADPCALGKTLELKGIDFTAHVIGFDVKKAEAAGLQCLAKNTGGIYATARDAGSLKKAMERTVTEVKKKAAQPVKKKSKTEEGVRLIAAYKEGGAEFKGDINWFVLEAEADATGKRKQVIRKHRGKSGHVFHKLPAGNYVIVAELSDTGYIRREYRIEVKEGEAATHELALNIGKVRFDARPGEGAQPFKEDLGWKVLFPKADLSGKHKELTNLWRKKSGSVFLLPAGQWLISARLADWGWITAGKEITVEPAGEEAHEFIFNAGQVRFDARLAEGASPFKGDLGWKVFFPKADLSGKRKELTNLWRKKSGHIFWLPAGQWLIAGRLADSGWITAGKEITVDPAGGEAHAFIFNAGRVRFDARLAEGGQPFKGDLGFWVLFPKADLSGKRKGLTSFWRKKTGGVYFLPAGDWLVRAALADYRHVTTEKRISLKPGEEQPQEFLFNAGQVRFDVTLEGAPWSGQVAWNVYDAQADSSGNRRKITNAWRVKSGKITFLPAGDYLVQSSNPDNRGMKAEATFSIGAGKEKQITLDWKKP
jgi:Ca-activated chloride channel family protein